MDARTQKFMDDLNGFINTLYTLNFSCLKAGARGNQPGNTSNDAWLNDKMRILSNQRNSWINEIHNAVLNLEDCGFNAAMDKFKLDFMETFEQVYGPSGSFDDNFDGFVIKHPQFKKDFYDLDILCRVSNSHPKFNLLCYNYLSFLNYYKQKISFESYDDIFSALVSDLQQNGYKSFYFERPDKNIELVSREEIERVVEYAKELLNQTTISTKSAVKKHLRAYKKVNNPKVTEKALDKYAHCKALYEHEENQQAFAVELNHLAKIFEKRLESANTPSNTTLINTWYENINDLLSGVNIFDDKNNYHTDKVYIHAKEYEYYKYLIHQLETLKKYEVKKGESQITQREF